MNIAASAIKLAAGYQGVNHALCLASPIGSGTLLKAQLDRTVSGSPSSFLFRHLFDLHRALDVLLYVVGLCG